MSVQTNSQTNTTHQAPPAGNNSGVSGGFVSGNSANMTAVLALIAAMLELYNDKNEQFVNQSKAENNIATKFSDGQRAYGEQEYMENLTQGLCSIAGGAFTLGTLAYGHLTEEKPTALNNEVTGATGFRNNLGNDNSVSVEDPQANEIEEIEMLPIGENNVVESESQENLDANRETSNTRLNKMIEEIKSGEYKFASKNGEAAEMTASDRDVVTNCTDDQITELREAVQTRIDNLQQRINNLPVTNKPLWDKISMGSQGVSNMSTGGGQIAAGHYKQQGAEQQADNTLYQNGQQELQSLAKETESQSDQDLQAAQGLLSLIPEISKSNNAILSA